MTTCFGELYTPPERNFENALVALNSLQSNVSTIAAWTASRKDGTIDWKEEVMHHVNAVGINLSELSVIHVAGTKGKGSTCAFVESIIRSSGHRTGLYTSPHLIDVRERIRIDGKILDKEQFASQFWFVWDKLAAARTEKFPTLPPFFRFITLLAFRIFEISKLDACIIEVGIGGRTDATNVFTHPATTGITSLGYDHMNVLGNTLPEIAFEKAGIMKLASPAFSVAQLPEAMQVIEDRARDVGAPLVVPPPLETFFPSGITLGLNGVHQKSNAALAIALSQAWLHSSPNSKFKPSSPISPPYLPSVNNYNVLSSSPLPPFIAKGLTSCRWAGRAQIFQIPEHTNMTFYVDGAHTAESTEACADWFNSCLVSSSTSTSSSSSSISSTSTNSSPSFTNSLNVIVFHCGRGRNPGTLLEPITQHSNLKFDKAIFTTFSIFPNTAATLTKILYNDNDPQWQKQIGEKWQELSGMKPEACELHSCVAEGVDSLKTLAKQNPSTRINVLVTGSLYLVGAVLQVCKVDV